ncbi:MAG: HlyD family efflux transporter periplasmic adaptor subunit [Pseudomonadota bacterium]
MRFFSRAISGLFLLSLTLALLAAAGWQIRGAIQERQAEEDRRGAPRERVFTAEVIPYLPEDIAPELTVFGEIRSSRTLELRAPSGGRVVELYEGFLEGGAVTAGEVLLRTDPAEAQSLRDTARANLRQAEVELADAERSLDLAAADLDAARLQADLRLSALERQRDLLDRGAGTTAAVETAELASASAEQSVVSRRLALAQAQGRIELAQTALERERISLADAERRFADTELRADFDGVLSDVTVTAGRLVGQNEQVAQLIDPTALEVRFRVSTAQYSRLLGPEGRLTSTPITVTLDVLGLNISAPAVLTREAGSVAEGQSGRVLFAELDHDPRFRPGDFVTVAVTEPTLPHVALLPATALSSENTVLALGAEDRLEAIPVTLLRRQGDDVIIRSPALQGREVVRRVSPVLGAGIRIEPVRRDTADQAALPEAPEMLSLDPERRARLVAFVEDNVRMPSDVRERLLQALDEEEVPAQVVRRLESRMGG